MRKKTVFIGAFLFVIPILVSCPTVQNPIDAQAVEHYFKVLEAALKSIGIL